MHIPPVHLYAHSKAGHPSHHILEILYTSSPMAKVSAVEKWHRP